MVMIHIPLESNLKEVFRHVYYNSSLFSLNTYYNILLNNFNHVFLEIFKWRFGNFWIVPVIFNHFVFPLTFYPALGVLLVVRSTSSVCRSVIAVIF